MKAVYEIFIDNIRKGIINPRELDSLENGLKQMERRIKQLEEESDTLADTVNMLSPLMMKCYNLKKLLEEVLNYGEEGLCIDGKFAERIAKAIEK